MQRTRRDASRKCWSLTAGHGSGLIRAELTEGKARTGQGVCTAWALLGRPGERAQLYAVSAARSTEAVIKFRGFVGMGVMILFFTNGMV